MKINSLTLVGYNRFALNDISSLKITPVSKIQLILGTNGSGKSSLMRELSPLPADSKDFKKDGPASKVIEITNNGDSYTLVSRFNPQKHEFWKNGTNINPGGTLSAQKELVKQEFGITPEVHELLTGQQVFHKMGPGERRSWFTKLSDVNYNYALAFHQKLKEKLRDSTGTFRHLQERLVHETGKLLKDNDEQELRTEITELRSIINKLHDLKPSAVGFTSEFRNKANSNNTKISDLTKQIRDLRNRFLNLENFTSIEDIDNAFIAASARAQSIEMMIENVSKDMIGQQSMLDQLIKSNLTSASDVDEQIKKDEATIENLRRSLRSPVQLDTSSYQSAVSAIDTISNQLAEILTVIEVDTDMNFTREKAQDLVARIEVNNTNLRQLNDKLLYLENRKKDQEHFKQHNSTECPKCAHKWIRDFDENLYNELVQGLVTVNGDIEKCIILAESLEKERVRLDTYASLLNQFMTIVKSWPILENFWRWVSETNLLRTKPVKICQELSTLREDLLIFFKIQQHQDTFNEHLELKKALEADEKMTLGSINARIAECDQKLFELNQSLINNRKQCSRYADYKAAVQLMGVLALQLTETLTDQQECSTKLTNSLRLDMFNNIIRDISVSLTFKEQLLSQADIQRALVNDINSQLVLLEKRIHHLKVLVDEMSPSSGLIAKGLSGFINTFVRQMNGFIKKVWLYPMELIPILPDGDYGVDLDYKFELRVANCEPIPDVAKGSAAMKEIIDLAFRIVATKYLKLGDAPLFLDELGATFDPMHRHAIYEVINGLITLADFSNIFIVSHYNECYGSLVNADVLVLNSLNAVIPEGCVYNRHVEMK